MLPAATATEAGTVAAELLLDNVTVAPPVGAALLRVMVAIDEEPRTTLAGFNDTESNVTRAVIVRAALFETPSYVAVIVALVEAVAVVVVMLNVALLLPAAIVTVAGTTADVLLLASITVAPPVGAALVRVTVPVDDVPAATVAGATVKEVGAIPPTALSERVTLDPAPIATLS